MATIVEAVGGFSATSNLSKGLNAAPLQSSWPAGRITKPLALAPIQIGIVNDRGCSSGSRAVFPVCRGLRKILSGRPPLAMTVSMCSSRVSKQIVSEAQETVTAAGSVNQTTFQNLVLESDIPVLVDFWAPWCGPCRMIAPIIDELARQYAGKLKCLKLNTDECPDIATEYGIRSIPTVMIFVNGEKKDTVIGAVPKSTLTTTIEKYLDW